jgi:hypothetical protein
VSAQTLIKSSSEKRAYKEVKKLRGGKHMGRRQDSRQQTSESRKQTADSRQQTAARRKQTADSRQQAAERAHQSTPGK